MVSCGFLEVEANTLAGLNTRHDLVEKVDVGHLVLSFFFVFFFFLRPDQPCRRFSFLWLGLGSALTDGVR